MEDTLKLFLSRPLQNGTFWLLSRPYKHSTHWFLSRPYPSFKTIAQQTPTCSISISMEVTPLNYNALAFHGYQTLEGQLADEELGALLVMMDLMESHCSWPVTVRFNECRANWCYSFYMSQSKTSQAKSWQWWESADYGKAQNVAVMGKCRIWQWWESAEYGSDGKAQNMVVMGKCRLWAGVGKCRIWAAVGRHRIW